MTTAAFALAARGRPAARATSEPVLVRLPLTASAVAFLALFLVMPLAAVFA
jgi:ABC-type sulfate transport system permease subunit